jgi:hypothetical protein
MGKRNKRDSPKDAVLSRRLAYLNELLEETFACAEEEGATDSLDGFKAFVEAMIPEDVLSTLSNEAHGSLEDLWDDRYAKEALEAEAEEDLSDVNSDHGIEDGCCELCDRELRLTRHHLIPREMHERVSRTRGTPKEVLNRTAALCRMCHNAVHRFFSNMELAFDFNTIELLLADDRVYKYAKWASTLQGRGNLRMHR